MTTNKEVLEWIYARMLTVYGENKDADYMLRFKQVIDDLEDKGEETIKSLSERFDDFEKENHEEHGFFGVVSIISCACMLAVVVFTIIKLVVLFKSA